MTELKDTGIIFFNRKTQTVFISDEIVWILREIQGIEIPSKYQRRILRHLTDAEINLVARKHHIDRKLKKEDKIQAILEQGINITNLLSNDIFKDDVSKSDKAKRIEDLITKELELDLSKMGRSLEERVSLVIEYDKDFERDDTISLSRDGYRNLLNLMVEFSPKLNEMVRNEFELQDEGYNEP